MPWKECHVMDERLRFVARLLEGEKMAPLCAEFGISRKTGYKIYDRYKDCGVQAFSDRSRRPHRQANRLPPQLEAVIVRLKREYPGWGAPKIREKLRRQSIRLAMRAAAAIAERRDPTVLIPLVNLVPGLARNPERGAQRRHLLALEQAGHKPEPLVHDVTLLPRHAPSCGERKVSPMCPEYRVTYLSGRTQNSSKICRVQSGSALGFRAQIGL